MNLNKDLKFDTNAAFNGWLKETTAKVVTFDDFGQDLRKFYIASNGEIIHVLTPNLGWIYNGMFVVNYDTLEEFGTVCITDNGKKIKTIGFPIDRLVIKKHESNSQTETTNTR